MMEPGHIVSALLEEFDPEEVENLAQSVYLGPQPKTDENDNVFWVWKGELHREDGPAIEWKGGQKEWWLNGELHRTNGPAIEYPDGSKSWYLNGKRHRVDGPAVEWAGGHKEWWLNGEKAEPFTAESFVKALVDEQEIDPEEVEAIATADYDGAYGLSVDAIFAKAKEVEGKRKLRTIWDSDAKDFIELVHKYPDKHIRVYSSEGFVANAYMYRVYISFIWWDGKRKLWGVSTTDAKRSRGQGNLRVVR